MNKKIVISNYNWNLDWLKITHEHGFTKKDIVIYDSGNDQVDWSHIGEVIKVSNYGGNQYSILRFIVDNYNSLPDTTIFTKGNILFHEKIREKTYSTLDRFIQSLYSDEFFSCWVDQYLLVDDLRHTEFTPYEILKEGRLIQPASHYIGGISANYKHFFDHRDLLNWCFENPPKSNNIEFIPTSSFSVPKKNILKYSKNLYEKLLSILDYEESYLEIFVKQNLPPAELHVLERIFYFIWFQDLTEKE